MLVLGVLVAGAGVLELVHERQHRDRLLAVGTPVPAQVVGLHHAERGDTRWIDVRYTVAGVSHLTQLEVLSASPPVGTGQTLVIYVDPHRPEQAAARGFDVPTPPPAGVVPLGVAIGTVLIPTGAALLLYGAVDRARGRREVQHGPAG